MLDRKSYRSKGAYLKKHIILSPPNKIFQPTHPAASRNETSARIGKCKRSREGKESKVLYKG